jgi:glyoxylase-like metal-dependent hydrolase (beta-lactamase superfamily II)
MIFRQLFEPVSSTWTYLLGCEETGDALLIDGCGRTDFQNGDAATLYRTITGKLFSLPDEVLVYPGHDYQGRRVSSIGQEKTRNPRIGGGKSLEEFVRIMAQLDLAYPKFMDFAVPGNQQCGICPAGIPENMDQYCEQWLVPGSAVPKLPAYRES